jgi:hypothetical protein
MFCHMLSLSPATYINPSTTPFSQHISKYYPQQKLLRDGKKIFPCCKEEKIFPIFGKQKAQGVEEDRAQFAG